MSIDFLAVGTVSRDIATADPTSAEYVLGGTVSFAAVTAARLGRRPVVLTRAGDDIDLSLLRALADVHVLPSKHTTTFANLYTPDGRVQYCYTPSPPIAAEDVPPRLRVPHIALLGPLANEVLPEVARVFDSKTIVAAVPQGWMRRWDADGRVHSAPWTSMAEILPHLDALILSIEDIDGDLRLVDEYLEYISLVVITEYRDGSTVYRRNAATKIDQDLRIDRKMQAMSSEEREKRSESCSLSPHNIEVIPVPPRPADELDPTGAGDIFATAFLLRLDETGDPLDAARYANVTASFGVEGQGVSGIPTHEQVLAYMAQNPWQPATRASSQQLTTGHRSRATAVRGILELPIDAIQANPHQPRTLFDPDSLAELSASIRKHGVIQPLIVTESPNQPQRFWLITGERRWRAARQAGIQTVPVIVREATPQQLLEWALVENLQRADLNPLEEAAAYATLMNEFDLTQSQVAERVGKSRSAVANAVRLLSLPAAAQNALNDQRISAGHARALLSLKSDADRQRALNLILERELNVRQTETLVRRWMEEPPAAELTEDPPHMQAHVRFWENRFRDRLSTKVSLERQADGSGRLVIHFFNDDDLETIYREILGDEDW